eukprot:TRINITY_DN20779_c0_g1_i1.p1 TRINITY_DN20779_c0_g1~~TRINITY_DN20779_c0_g1_i1.p1  ORF type:complete len:390 (-),score=82.37 TRINITY_DN20779_c0_g1_i1:69-1238(-)
MWLEAGLVVCLLIVGFFVDSWPFIKGCKYERSPDFMKNRIGIRQHGTSKFWTPIDVKVSERGVTGTGLRFWTACRMILTLGLEYYVHVLFRTYLAQPDKVQPKHDAHEVYVGVVNTSLLCFMDPKSGNLVIENVKLVSNRTKQLPLKGQFHKTLGKIEAVLDHQKEIVVAVIVDGQRISDVGEICALLAQVAALKSHVYVHFFANGVSDCTEIWRLAEESNNITQLMNCFAAFSSPKHYEVDQETMLEILGNNANTGGLPFHSHKEVAKVGSRFSAFKMTSKARALLREHFKGVADAHLLVEAILAATIGHSFDHYCFDKYLSCQVTSNLLESDYSKLKKNIFGWNDYVVIKIRCVEHLDDPVCQILYRTCVEFEPDFANRALFIGTAS